MPLVVRPLVKPAELRGMTNGQAPEHLVVRTAPTVPGTPWVELCPTATRAWRAMAAAASADGLALVVVDTYRPYADQLLIFLARYTTQRVPGERGRWFQGRLWYKKPGYATAAVPGTSNHGWLLAIDGTWKAGVALAWLSANADRFGFSWELLPEEPWHIRYYTGDRIPQAVLDYEAGQQPTPPTPEPEPDPEDDDMAAPAPQYVTTKAGKVWTIAAEPSGEANGWRLYTCMARAGAGPMLGFGGTFISGLACRPVGENSVEVSGVGADGETYVGTLQTDGSPPGWRIPK